MIRKAFCMSVNPGMEEEYARRHNPIPDELAAALKAGGASNYSIFRMPGASLLFAYVEIEDEDRWAAVSETDACLRWWRSMSEIMPSNPDSSPVATELPEVFHLD